MGKDSNDRAIRAREKSREVGRALSARRPDGQPNFGQPRAEVSYRAFASKVNWYVRGGDITTYQALDDDC